jgi:hypothetical protein
LPDDEGDQNEENPQTTKSEKVNDAYPEAPTEVTSLSSKAGKEAKNTRVSPSGMEVVKEAPSRGQKRLHESESSNSNKESVPTVNGGELNFKLWVVPMDSSLRGWIEVKKKKGEKGRIDKFFYS